MNMVWYMVGYCVKGLVTSDVLLQPFHSVLVSFDVGMLSSNCKCCNRMKKQQGGVEKAFIHPVISYITIKMTMKLVT